MSETATRRSVDAFYAKHGACCAGCDWWRYYNSMAGDCTRSAPIPGNERAAMLGMHGVTLQVGAGHAITPRHHLCGEFKDAPPTTPEHPQ